MHFWLFPEVLEGLGKSGRLVGSISTLPGTYKSSWYRVMAKNPHVLFVYGMYITLRSNFDTREFGSREICIF